MLGHQAADAFAFGAQDQGHPFGHSIALHARSLTFLHPTTHEPISVRAEVPKLWRGRFAYLLNQPT